MSTRTLETSAQFEAWLNEHRWFADACVLSLTPLPCAGQGPLPESVTMELAYQIDGNWRAHSISTSRHMKLIATNIREYRLLEDRPISPTHCSYGMELVSSADDALAFSIDLPAILILRCGKATVEALPDLVEIIQPRLSNKDVSADVQGDRMPTPEEWVRLFEGQGAGVAWHVYGEQLKTTSEVPELDYRGWFIQDPQNLDVGHQGIFFFYCDANEHGFEVAIQNHGASPQLWRVAKRILGQFKHVQIRCGNCIMTGPEWLDALEEIEGAP
jgi:hypothetical protein